MSKPKKVEERVKQNFIKHIKKKAYRHDDKWKTDFHFAVNSKAFFGLSEQAFKLYCSLILQGKNKFTSLSLLAGRVNKSVRQVQRIKEELEINGFLKIIRVKPTTYEYIFDYSGRLNEKKPETKAIEKEYEIIEKPKVIHEEHSEVPIEILEKAVEKIKEEPKIDEDLLVIEKAKTIVEYSDFAILNNKFWGLKETTKKEIIKIIEERIKNESQNRNQLKWIYERII